MVGAVYLAHIHFTDGSASKLRPILILKRNSFNDLVYLPLTSNLSIPGIIIKNDSLNKGDLPKDSVIVLEKIGVIAELLLVRKLCEVKESVFKEIKTNLIRFIDQD